MEFHGSHSTLVELSLTGVIRKITSALPAARPQPQIIRGTIDGSRRGRTNVFTPCNQSESMEPGRVNKFQFRFFEEVTRPMTTSPPFFNIFERGAESRREKQLQQQKLKNSILITRHFVSKNAKEENSFPNSFFHILRIFVHFSSPKFNRLFVGNDSFLDGIKSGYTIQQKKLRDIPSRFLSMANWTDGLLISEARKRGVASGARRKRCGSRCSKKMNRWQSEPTRARRAEV